MRGVCRIAASGSGWLPSGLPSAVLALAHCQRAMSDRLSVLDYRDQEIAVRDGVRGLSREEEVDGPVRLAPLVGERRDMQLVQRPVDVVLLTNLGVRHAPLRVDRGGLDV